MAAPAVKAPAAVPDRSPVSSHDQIVTGAGAAKKAAGNGKSASGKPSVGKSTVGGAATGAATGAALGSVVPGIGTAVGAGAGAAVGGIGGAMKGHAAKKAWYRSNAQGGARQVLVLEFVLSIVILAFGPLTDRHKDEGPGEFMKRGSALCALFLILGLIGAGGPKAAKVAAGFGGIVCVSLLVSNRSIFTVIAKKFNTPLTGPAGPPDDGSEVIGEGIGEAPPGPAAPVAQPQQVKPR
jgi:hypothetical protein